MSHEGRQQLLPNVLAGWLAFCATAMVGFVMPRLILNNVGQELLGIWDLCWSFLIYITFTGIGTGTAIGHYTAKANSELDRLEAQHVFATGFYVQLAIGIIVAAIFAAIVGALPVLLVNYHSDQLELISTIGSYVSLTVVVVLLGEIAHGALVGNHQARKSEYINVAHDITLAMTMVVALFASQGIVGLAVATLFTRIVFELIRFGVALKQVPGCTFNPGYVTWKNARHMALFAAKSSIYGLQELIIYQAIRILFFVGVGPIVFAAFSRYSTLARQINRLVDRLVIPVPALTSDYSARGEVQQIREIYLYGLRGILMVSLPTIVIFGVLGDQIVGIWMGTNFVIPNLAWIFCCACLLHTHYSMSAKILRGINSHGRISAACLISSSLVLYLAYFVVPPTDATQAAWLIAVVMSLCVHVPHILFTWRKLALPVFKQIQDIYYKPLLLNTIFLILIVQCKAILLDGQILLAGVIFLGSIAGLSVAYWYLVCDQRMRHKLIDSVSNRFLGHV